MSEVINEKHICDYGCGQEAHYKMSNGKWCCESFYTKCPELKKRLTNFGSKNGSYGKSFNKGKPSKKKGKKYKVIREKPELCEYGCGQKATYYIEYLDKWRCSKSRRICNLNKKKDKNKKENPRLCEYGCGQEAKFYNIYSNKWCCSKNSKLCPENKTDQKFKPIETDQLCSYGCGERAKYQSKNGKLCCSDFSSKCSKMKKKNSIGNKGKGRNCEGKLIPTNRLCSYGCGKKANYILKNGKLCCSNFTSKCDILRNKNAEGNIGKKRSKEFKEVTRRRMLNGGSVYASSFIQNPSKPQVELFNRTKELYPQTILNYPLYRGEGKRDYSLDIAIPELRICIESDGTYWHQDKKNDLIRQKEIEESGWRLIRYYPVDDIKQVPSKEQIKFDIERILNV